MIAQASITPFITTSPISAYQVCVCVWFQYQTIRAAHEWTSSVSYSSDLETRLSLFNEYEPLTPSGTDTFTSTASTRGEESTVCRFNCCSDSRITQEMSLTNERTRDQKERLKGLCVCVWSIYHCQIDWSVSEQRSIIFITVFSSLRSSTGLALIWSQFPVAVHENYVCIYEYIFILQL